MQNCYVKRIILYVCAHIISLIKILFRNKVLIPCQWENMCRKQQVHEQYTCSSLLRIRPNGRHILAINGISLCTTASFLPIGALKKSRNSASGFDAQRLAALHVSMTDPPPNARYESNWPCLANSTASLKLYTNIQTNNSIHHYE